MWQLSVREVARRVLRRLPSNCSFVGVLYRALRGPPVKLGSTKRLTSVTHAYRQQPSAWQCAWQRPSVNASIWGLDLNAALGDAIGSLQAFVVVEGHVAGCGRQEGQGRVTMDLLRANVAEGGATRRVAASGCPLMAQVLLSGVLEGAPVFLAPAGLGMQLIVRAIRYQTSLKDGRSTQPCDPSVSDNDLPRQDRVSATYAFRRVYGVRGVKEVLLGGERLGGAGRDSPCGAAIVVISDADVAIGVNSVADSYDV